MEKINKKFKLKKLFIIARSLGRIGLTFTFINLVIINSEQLETLGFINVLFSIFGIIYVVHLLLGSLYRDWKRILGTGKY